MTILGLLTFLVSLFIVVMMLYIYFSGSGLPPVGVITAASFLVIPVIIYLVSASYWKRKGIPIAKQFDEVPPE